MAEKDKGEKRIDKNDKAKANVIQKVGSFFVRIGKRLKNFFINLKAEMKRVIWPDKKRLVQNTATVLAICVLAGLILFIVDSALGGILNAVGFYTPSTTETTTVATTTTASSDTTAATTGATTSAGTSETTVEVTTASTAG